MKGIFTESDTASELQHGDPRFGAMTINRELAATAEGDLHNSTILSVSIGRRA
jgi:hypothetical protein